MGRIRRAIAAVLIAVFTYSILGSSLNVTFAVESPITVTVDNYANGKLDFHWDQKSGTAAAVVAYHKPAASASTTSAPAVLVTSGAITVGNSYSITGLKSDYIYDITVTLYDSIDESGNLGNVIGNGLLFYLPSITFTSAQLPQETEAITGGGLQIGSNPRLKLSWKIPKAFYDPDDKVYPEADSYDGDEQFIEANRHEARAYMQSSLRKIYNDTRELATLNYRINISSRLNLLNSGSAQSALLIEQSTSNEDAYKVSISSVTSSAVNVAAPDAQRYLSFELWGHADENTPVKPPATPSGIELLDEDIYPGTVYYMNIKPVYYNSSGMDVNAVSVGDPEDQDGSMLSGEQSYTYTPIRFQITKDSANNIYVKIYKINQGSLDLPRLYYEIQASDVASKPGDWVVKKTMDDSYFSGNTAVSIITGVNPNNKIYYKIVVKSDSTADRLESLPLPYTLVIDTSRPPLPTGIVQTDSVLSVGQVSTPTGASITVKSSDITISWDKPLNWDTVKNDLYFHFLLNTNQTEITTDVPLYAGNMLWGNFPAIYRLVKYVSANSPEIHEEGNRLSYTLKAFDLFNGECDGGVTEPIPHTSGYPSFLVPNTVYYLQMYTTTAANRGTSDKALMSDKSVITSFTTKSGEERDVPLPMSFQVTGNGKDTSVTPNINYVELQFDKVSNIDYRNYFEDYDNSKYSYATYYDIFMNTHTNTSFIKVGSTQETGGAIVFSGVDDPQSTSIKARISRFTETDAVNLFGYNLLPNTTYYFKAVTRLEARSLTDPDTVVTKSSIETAILPVTTIRLKINPPDDNERKPLAPSDFAVALDNNQQPVITGNSVTFTWKRQENDVVYEMIRTSAKVEPGDKLSDYENDPEYTGFLKEYGNCHLTLTPSGITIDKFYIDPATDPEKTADKKTYAGFKYDPVTQMCTYTVDRKLFPNKLYYFSLKAVRVDSDRIPLKTASGEPSSESVWVSVPVTTSLIDAPSSLEVVVTPELGFWWSDPTEGLTADDYKIYAKASSESDYKLMSKSQATIIKDKDGMTYYGRITGLKINTYYDIRVTKGANTPVFERSGYKTRDGYHELEIKWKGKPVDDYSRYDIAIMAEGGKEYTVLTSEDLEQYVSKDNKTLPYLSEETATTVNTDEVYYHARIKSAEVELPGGLATHQPLRSNVKYYIKVRAVKIDPIEPDLISYSKYIGPVNSRTEFNQSDYDNTDREEQQKAVFLDKMDELEKGYYWRVAITDGTANRILLKGDKVSDAMKNSSGDTFTVDMTKITVNINKDEIYIPISVIKAMNSMNRNLSIKTADAELLLKPTTLDAAMNEQIKEILGKQEVKDLYVRLTISRSTTSSTALPSNLARASDINELDVQAWGLDTTDSDIKQRVHDKLYDKDNGLVNEKLNMLLNSYVGDGTGSSALIDQYTQSLVDLIEKELSTYIDTTLQSVKLDNAVRDITVFGAPASANLSAGSGKGLKQAYVLYDDSSAWQKVSSGTVQSGTIVRFNLIKTGKYVILTSQTNIGDVPAGYWAEGYIAKLASRYDLSGVFTGINNGFMPENKATCSEVVLLYEKVTGKTDEDAGLSIRQKTVKLGLDGIIGANSLMKNVKRQETAAVLLKLFSVKKGVSPGSLKPAGLIDIADESSIDEAFYNPVVMIVDMKVMTLDGGNKFYPDNQMTRAELVAAFVRLLEKVGE